MRQRALFLSLLCSGTTAFVSTTGSRKSDTSLQLLPGQGCQLKAACEAATSRKTKVIEVEPQVQERSFVSRVFSLPSTLIRRHPHPKAEELDFLWKTPRKQDDVVLYPVVGFQFVENDGKFVALPTTANAACRLPTKKDEDIFGWYSPACSLDLFSEDPCQAPEETSNEEN